MDPVKKLLKDLELAYERKLKELSEELQQEKDLRRSVESENRRLNELVASFDKNLLNDISKEAIEEPKESEEPLGRSSVKRSIKYVESVRKASLRENLPATDCAECHSFYSMVGIVDGKRICDHRQEVSRHRHLFLPPKTPPKFWDVDFPDG